MTHTIGQIDYALANESDIPAMVKLLAQLFAIEQDFSAHAGQQAQGLAMLLQNTQTACIQIARNGAGEVMGMVSAQLVISTAQGSASAWIEDMVIDTQYRRRGIGKHLLQNALTWAKANGATRAQLLVDIDNTQALGYYAHHGWASTQLEARRIFL
ncbi:MAG TPA: GNAT family N-acetyltransferase [Methylophilus sp.]